MGETLRRFWEQRGDAIILNALQIALIVALLLVARWLGARVIGVITRALTRKVEASERRQAQIRTVSALLNSVLGYVLLFVGLLSILGALGVTLRLCWRRRASQGWQSAWARSKSCAMC